MKQKNSYIIISILVFIYIVFRAIYVPLAHDEIATFYFYIQTFQFNPFTDAHGDANNHIINSILSGLSFKMFGFSSLSMRLANVLSFIPFAIYVFKTGRFLNKASSRWMFYLGMLLTVNFIQFFALTRGYGLSMAFLMVAFYYILRLYKKASWKNVLLVFFALSIALFSNLSTMTLVLISLCFVLLTIVINYREYLQSKKQLVLTLLAFVGMGFSIKIALSLSFFLKEGGLLYYGNLDGFWNLTIRSMLDLLFENNGIVVQLITGFSIIILFVVYVFNFRKDKLRSILNPNYMFFFMLVGVFIGIEILALVLKVNYPEDRVALYLLPLFVLAMCFGVDNWNGSKRMRFALLPLVFLPIHFIVGANFNKISIWPKDSMPDRFYETVKKYDNNTKYPANVGGYLLREFTYTNKVYRAGGMDNMIQVWGRESFDSLRVLKLKNHPGMYEDFLISKKKDLKAIKHLYDSIDYDPICKHFLFERKEKTKIKLFNTTDSIKTNNVIQNEYFNLINQEFDSLGTEGVLVGVDLEIDAKKAPFKARIVVDVKNVKTNERILYNHLALDWLKYSWKKEDKLIKSFYLHNLPKWEKVKILVYIWNIEKEAYQIIDGEVELFKIK